MIGSLILSIEKITNNTIFELASISKLYTSISILILEEMGKLKLEDEVIKYAPQFIYLENVSIFDLMSFITPLTFNNKTVVNKITADMDYIDAKEILYNAKENVDFNSTNLYSDISPMILKYVIEGIMHIRLHDFIQKYILEPART